LLAREEDALVRLEEDLSWVGDLLSRTPTLPSIGTQSTKSANAAARAFIVISTV